MCLAFSWQGRLSAWSLRSGDSVALEAGGYSPTSSSRYLPFIHLQSFLSLTIIGDVWYLEASGTVGFTSFKVDPQLPGPCSEGDGSLISLACLIGGDGGRRCCKAEQNRTMCCVESPRSHIPR